MLPSTSVAARRVQTDPRAMSRCPMLGNQNRVLVIATQASEQLNMFGVDVLPLAFFASHDEDKGVATVWTEVRIAGKSEFLPKSFLAVGTSFM